MYNTAGCIARCVKSICTQTYKSIEILLLNDGSTYDTLAVCRALAANDHRIAPVLGLSTTRMRLSAAASFRQTARVSSVEPSFSR